MTETTATTLSQQEQSPSPFTVVTSRQARAMVRKASVVFVMMHVLGMTRIPKGEVLRKLAERGRQKIQVSVFENTVCIIAMSGLMAHLEQSS